MKGDVVVLNFPFSDLSQTKRRPALALASLAGDDAILCQITSPSAVRLLFRCPRSRRLHRCRPQSKQPNPAERVFTAGEGIILYRAGHISTAKLTDVVNRLIEILKQA